VKIVLNLVKNVTKNVLVKHAILSVTSVKVHNISLLKMTVFTNVPLVIITVILLTEPVKLVKLLVNGVQMPLIVKNV